MGGFAVASTDTALWAYYFFIRGLLIARRRKHGKQSFVLHSHAMTLGILFTMTILFQRPFQFGVICFRWLLEAIVPTLPVGPARETVYWLATSLLDHNIVLSITTLVLSVHLLVMLDGPWSGAVMRLLRLNYTDEEKVVLYGSTAPTDWELLFWRCRLPLCLMYRAYITDRWTSDPAHV